ncbi:MULTISPECIES: hypothetical protein [unclassified Paraburkholderia]|uniref:hypothetical protein n=1 Tax=unclassified Paraburkholderia TaxID=2615204 RepID=UPI001608643E|nr:MULTISPECIES: hypothetical protein [unclassified Paraburkholderia]MBB5448233.1 hypothetical protein [Paraburkholderia sp. WSM4177]MBB5488592.1 hypothetical protein [Paraburkholderia sp. WSM4180]
MSLDDVIRDAIAPALAILPSAMDSRPARVMLLAIGLQESHFTARRQMNGGPARGFWQFEQGTAKSHGGVWGVYLHDASRYWLNVLCEARHVGFDPVSIYSTLEHDDILAAGVARLLLFTDPPKLPAADDTAGAWAVYLRTWQPGKPRPESWPEFHRQAVDAAGAYRNAEEA